MANFAVLGVTAAVIAGLALSAYHFWRNRTPSRSILLFLLPALELDIAVALIDIKLLFTVFILIIWVYVWNNVNGSRKVLGK